MKWKAVKSIIAIAVTSFALYTPVYAEDAVGTITSTSLGSTMDASNVTLAPYSIFGEAAYDITKGPIGSGFYIKGGYFVTNAHVAKYGFGMMRSLDINGNTVFGKEVARDFDLDLSLFKTSDTEHSYVTLADSPTTDNVFRNYGNGMTESSFIQTGALRRANVMVGIDEIGTHAIMDEYNVPISPGSSGSAVLNSRNEVAGVIRAMDFTTKLAYAIPLRDLKTFIDSYFSTHQTP